MKLMTKFWIGLGVLALLSPLGVIFPEYFKASGAWGEWSADEIKKLIGYVPQGLEKLSSLWKAPMAGYGLKGYVSPIISAFAGAAVAALFAWAVGKMLSKKDE